MATNTKNPWVLWLVGIAQVNSGSIWGGKPAMPTLQNATKCVRTKEMATLRERGLC
ncbi:MULTISPECIES: hypothetical protein [Moorena]|uniref:Uncharacterized protein n=1 Tax=Moorena producens 3L TaxID=489825 RepID=F4XRV2_9CYAN|nr:MULTISPECIES: hypothetical protein [Moorena]EGJ32671.1 hypothetical protein LYNGBM3L_05280 [Moorena producens 3L]